MCQEATRLRHLRRRDRVDAHLLARRRCGSPDSAPCDRPLLHLHTQYNLSLPWPTIDMDFMNLNQAAHGDREFGHIESRIGVDRKIVAGHATDPRVVQRVAAWARAAVGPPRLTHPAARPLRRQHARRRGDRGRQGRGTAAVRRTRSTPTASTTWSPSSTRSPDKATAELAAEYVESYDVVARAAPRRRPARLAALRRPDRNRAAHLPHRGRLHRLHHQLRGPRRAAPAPRPRGPAADGRRLRLRRRGRLEDLRPAAHDEGRWARAAPAARRSWRTTPTTSAPAPRRPRRAHARGLPHHRRRTAAAARSTRSSIGGREDPVRLRLQRRPTAPPSSSASPTSATASG